VGPFPRGTDSSEQLCEREMNTNFFLSSVLSVSVNFLLLVIALLGVIKILVITQNNKGVLGAQISSAANIYMNKNGKTR